jgi:hypothetical protein
VVTTTAKRGASDAEVPEGEDELILNPGCSPKKVTPGRARSRGAADPDGLTIGSRPAIVEILALLRRRKFCTVYDFFHVSITTKLAIWPV